MNWMTTVPKSPAKDAGKPLLPGKDQMPSDLSLFAWFWLVIPAAIGLLLVWVIALELRQLYRKFHDWIREVPHEDQNKI
ncbi:hypothetical protein HER14_04735 [Acidithiobacillus thiooxidans]|uniref:hypothetical protein n=1 Tax=Acidithiobacillus thiooxidans TaxID=930 RepID=UPI001C06C76C|nr:hypothetical protein [Acidithiobacillus thiooxidans]MBU2750261.1 hypothetical protein [Acidithiobacillus thiooxidans]